jgi:hypothetical protein
MDWFGVWDTVVMPLDTWNHIVVHHDRTRRFHT